MKPIDGSLSGRIIELLETSDDPDPAAIAQRLIPTLTASEREGLLLEALIKRVRAKISQGRVLPRAGIRIEWPSDQELELAVNQLGVRQAASEFGVTAETLRKRLRNHGLSHHSAPRSDFMREVVAMTKTFAEKMRNEGIRLGLAQAEAERVYVAGEWKFLADCSSRDLRIVAEEYAARAGENAERGAYYLAVATELEAGDFATVRAMCLADRGLPVGQAA